MKMKQSLGRRWSSIPANKHWICLLWLLSFTVLNPFVSPQTDFISIDCGGEGTDPYTDPTTNIGWQPDGEMMKVGSTGTILDPTLLGLGNTIKSLTTLRYFPDIEINTFCYELGPVTVGSSYLVRAGFLYGNYNGSTKLSTSFDLLLEADVWDSIEVTSTSARIHKEIYMTAQRSYVSICVTRSTGSDAPFISSLEIRPLSPDMTLTDSFKTDKLLMYRIHRYNFGAFTDDDIRFPNDTYDRIWYAQTQSPKTETETVILTPHKDDPPSPVMQTAFDKSADRTITLTISNILLGTYFMLFYFAELNSSVVAGNRMFNVTIDGILRTDTPLDIFSAVGSFKTFGTYIQRLEITAPQMVMTFNSTDNSLLGPIWNAYELFEFSNSPANITTSSDDVEVLSQVKMRLGLTDWTGDPCIPPAYPYPWVNCSFKTTPRVSSLILPNRTIQGNLPPEINLLQTLTEINLGNNSLTGNIPNWAALTNLKKLNLQNNNLSGPIPEFLGDLPYLVELSLQFNNFSGKIPQKIKDKASRSELALFVQGNQCLCDDNCCSIPPPGPPPPVNSTANNTVALSVGITGGAIFLAIVIFLVYYFGCRRLPTPQAAHSSYGSLHKSGPEKIKRLLLTYEEIKSATNNFSNVIGEGGFGKVYYGTLDKVPVAVKVLSHNSAQGRREFLNEVEILSTVHHKNLAALVGYCQNPELILVYEYLSGGSLRDHLNALEYLHSSCEPSIIHGDVKSNNIPLDDNMRGKFGDFGLSRIHDDENTDVATFTLRGTRGYLDLVYSSTLTVNEKSDVYSFGVVLLEIITGRPPYDSRNPEAEMSLAHWALMKMKKGVSIESMMDKKIKQDTYNISAVCKVMDISLACVSYEHHDRPIMGMVVEGLREAVNIEETGEMEFNKTDTSIVVDPKLHKVRAR